LPRGFSQRGCETWRLWQFARLAQVAFVEEPLPDGFSGVEPAPAGGPARFLTDDPEHVVIEVDAPARGFSFWRTSTSPAGARP
jgi:hypothetical protein